MPQAPRLHDGDTSHRKAEILAAATMLFQRDGFEGTPVTRIASEAGMTPANLYWYFPSKQHLLEAVLISLYESSFESLLLADNPMAGASSRLTAYVKTFISFQLDSSTNAIHFGYLSLQNSLTPEKRQRLIAWQRKHREHLKAILSAGMQSGEFDIRDLSITTSMIVTSVEYVFLWFKAAGRLSVEQVADEYVRLALRLVLSGSETPILTS